MNVVGHSLGGHLSIVAKRLFPSLFSESYSFNGANFSTASDDFFSDINDVLIKAGSTRRVAGSFSEIENAVTRVISESSEPGNDLSVVPSMITGGVKVGDELIINTEKNSHSISQILDSLMIQSLMQRMGLSHNEIDDIYNASAVIAEKTQQS